MCDSKFLFPQTGKVSFSSIQLRLGGRMSGDPKIRWFKRSVERGGWLWLWKSPVGLKACVDFWGMFDMNPQ